jgi:hypothetical protein
MAYGAPFPDFLDWSWGELVEFITACNKKNLDDLRMQATMDFTHAVLVGKVFSSKKQKLKVIDEYPFLWSQEERNKIILENFERQMMAKCKKG